MFGLPQYSLDDLRDIAEAGFHRVGVVAAVILQTADTPKLLMLHHKPSEKVAAPGAWGPLAETSHIVNMATGTEVESAAATIYRSFEEETGMQADFLHPSLPSRSIGAFTTCKWPVGYTNISSFAFGIVPFLYLKNQTAANELITSFVETEEIDNVRFMSAAEIRHTRRLRTGTLDWLSVVENSASYNLRGPFVGLPRPHKLRGASQDVVFANLNL